MQTELFPPPAARPPRPAPTSESEEDRDAALVRRCRNGDLESYGLLVQRHQTRVTALVSRILGTTASPDDVDDAVQDVFVQAWRALPRFRNEARFSTWLYRIATNMAIKQWHKNKRRALIVSEDDLPEGARQALASSAPAPEAEAERRARDLALRRAIETLPEKQRTVVLLRYFEDCSCEEIGQMLGCSSGTVWSRLHYGCRALRGKLEWLGQN